MWFSCMKFVSFHSFLLVLAHCNLSFNFCPNVAKSISDDARDRSTGETLPPYARAELPSSFSF